MTNFQMSNDECQRTSFVIRHSSFVIRHSSFPICWLPIGISSLLFALAHAGQGSAPVALFFLAVILGYLYQRTHRIVPCITMHAMFNLLSIVGLLLRMTGPGE
jgi:membrane protease YdiL (CAAX protease family)